MQNNDAASDEKKVADKEEETDLQNDLSIAAEDDDEENTVDEQIPLKDRKLHTNPFDFIVSSISSQIKDGSIVLQDQFQRRRVWNDVKASRLIESLILNVPIPVCYFAEVDDGAYAVVDGQQRLTSIYRFLDNQYPLKGLKVRPDLNRKRFHEIPPVDQRLIKSRTIRCIVILKESNPDIRFDVFERLNTATVSLNRQEIRNSTYRGALNDEIISLCDYQMFKAVRKSQTSDKRMKDAELILRFFAFSFGGKYYKGRFTRHLDNYLDIGRRFDASEIAVHRAAFQSTLQKVHSVFGDDAFRRLNSNGKFDAQINSAIFDAVMLTFQLLSPVQIASADAILAAYREVCEDDLFLDAIGRATRDTARLNTRIARWVYFLRKNGIFCPEIHFGTAANESSVIQ